jgi:hypothetical protein
VAKETTKDRMAITLLSPELEISLTCLTGPLLRKCLSSLEQMREPHSRHMLPMKEISSEAIGEEAPQCPLKIAS